jgi:Fe2+ or Zn2+ uptake regulation protein
VTEELSSRLRAQGLRVTAPRVAVLRVLTESDDHPSAELIAQRVREQLGSVSIQAVYQVLDALQRADLLRRIEPAHGPARYEARIGDNHHHVVCRRCGRAEDVDCAVGRAPCLTPAESHGFVLDEAEVTHWGLCPQCQKEDERV